MPDESLDISNNNGVINWAGVHLDPAVKLVIAKCTEGRSFADPQYVHNKAGILARGLTFGAYHFARPDTSTPSADAANFLAHIGPLRPNDLVALDCERAVGGMRPGILVDWMRQWLQTVQTVTQKTPLFYTSRGFIDGPLGGNLDCAPLTRYPLWLASWGGGKPNTLPWPSMVLWQFTETQPVNGIHGYVDASYIENAGFLKIPGQTTIAVPNPTEVALALNAPVVSIKVTPSGNGYWMACSDGGVLAYGDAPFMQSEGGKAINAPVVGFDCTPDGTGYWLAAADGGVYSFGSAQFYGSMGGRTLVKPIVDITAMPDGKGYILVGADGGVFTYGSAHFYGTPA